MLGTVILVFFAQFLFSICSFPFPGLKGKFVDFSRESRDFIICETYFQVAFIQLWRCDNNMEWVEV